MRSKLATKACCRRCFGGTKARLLEEGYGTVKSSLHIDNLIRKLRTAEGVIREKLAVNELEWQRAELKYGFLHPKGANSRPAYVNKLDEPIRESQRQLQQLYVEMIGR